MNTAIKLNITFDQILEAIRQLPQKEKIKLSKALEKESIKSKLSELLTVFYTTELNQKTIDQEVETVRQQLYEKQKKAGHF
jgi:hypothetical protein